MLRFDLINRDKEPKARYKLIGNQRRRRLGWLWGIVLLAAVGASAGYVWQNPEIAEPYVDVPALTARFTQSDEASRPTAVEAEIVEDVQVAEQVAVVQEPATSTPLPTPTATAQPTTEPTVSLALVADITRSSTVDVDRNRIGTFRNASIGLGSVALQTGTVSFAVVGSDGASILDTPGGNEINDLEAGTLVDVTGRTSNSQWVMISSKSGVSGWTTAKSLVLFDVESLPVTSDSTAEVPGMQANTVAATPTAMPTAVPTAAPAPTTAAAAQGTTATTNQVNAAAQSPSSSTTPRRSILAVVRSSTPLRYNPNGDTLTTLEIGTSLNASGRSADGAWLYGTTSDGDSGWVLADSMVAFGQPGLPQVNATGAPAPPEPASPPPAAPAQAAASAPASAPVASSAASSAAPAQAVASTAGNTAASRPATARRPAPANPRNLPIATIATDGTRLNIRSGPSTRNAIIGKAQRGEQYVVIGRSNDNGWYQIEVPDLGGQSAWISARYARLDRASTNVPQTAAPASAQQPVAQQPVARPNTGSVPIPTPVALQPDRRGANSTLFAIPAANAGGLTGKLVFQQSLGGPIYVYELASGSLRQLSSGMDPEISPDGQRVVYSRFGGDGGIYTIDINGANERRIYVDTTARSPKWSPDGRWIVFSRVTGEYQCRNLGIGICLKNNPALTSLPLDNKEERGLSRININGDEFRDLAALNTAFTPDWNRNGVVYQAVTSIEITKDESDADTEAVLKQTIGYQDPDWQPNGGRIVFQGQQTSHWQIFSVQPNGGGLQALTRPVTALVDKMPSNLSPAWSPDGSHIVYLSNRAAGEEAGAWRLWVMNADGSNQRPLPINLPFEYAFNKEQMVSWGP